MSRDGLSLFYELLPLWYRRRDREQGEPLRALLGVIGEEYDRIHDDVARLYDDWFIETCSESVVPYIGDLVGVDARAPGMTASSRRTIVANAIRHRRRKGVPAILERALSDATGWAVRAVMTLDRLATTQSVAYPRTGIGSWFDVRTAGPEPLSPVEDGAWSIDVRTGAAPHAGGEPLNLGTVAVLVSRVETHPIEQGQPARVVEGCWTFDPLGRDVPLWNRPDRTARLLDPRPAAALPLPLTAAAIDAEPRRWIGPDRSVVITCDGVAVAPERIVGADLDDWDRPGPSSTGLLSAPLDLVNRLVAPSPRLTVVPDRGAPLTLALSPRLRLADAARALEDALRGAASGRVWREARVLTVGSRLLVVPGLPRARTVWRFQAAEGDERTVRDLGLAVDQARRAAVLRSRPLALLAPGAGVGSLRFRLGEDAAQVVSLPLDTSIERVAGALAEAVHARGLPWHAVRDGDTLLVAADAPNEGELLVAEQTRDDATTIDRLGLGPRVAIDPARGRFAVSLGWQPGEVSVSWRFGRAGDVGAGPGALLATPDDGVWVAEVRRAGARLGASAATYTTIVDALNAWVKADRPGVIRIVDSSRYETSVGAWPVSRPLTICAAPGEVPALLGRLAFVGRTEEARVHLGGLLCGGEVAVAGALRLEAAHCTIASIGAATAPDAPAPLLSLDLRSCLVGPIALPQESSLLHAESCVIDGRGGSAIDGVVGPDGATDPGPLLSCVGVTVLGDVYVDAIDSVVDCLFAGAVEARRPQQSRVSHSALPASSPLARTWRDGAVPVGCVLYGRDDTPRALDRPRFRSIDPAHHDYARLTDETANAYRTGSRSGGELGAYGSLREHDRTERLRSTLNEFVPIGTTAVVRFVS